MLRKEYRLRKNKDFRKVYNQKNSVATKSVVLYIMGNGKEGSLRVGFSISKKLGNAVVRNRCKRMLREAVRTHLREMRSGVDYIFVGRAPLARTGFSQVEKEVVAILGRKGCLTQP